MRWVLVAGLGAVAVILAWEWRMHHTRFELTVVPASGGEAVYFDSPGRQNDLLVDGGNASMAQTVTLPFLRSKGVNRLPAVLLTHGDLRHVGGVPLIHEVLPMDRVFAGPGAFRSSAYQAVIARFSERGVLRRVSAGESAGLWHVMHPAAGETFPRADDQALVLWGEFHGIRVLLLSDLGLEGQRVLMRRHPGLRADIVVTGMPAQSEPASNAMLRALRPSLVIVSESDYPASERAPAALKARLAGVATRVVCTRDTGPVTLEIRASGWTLIETRNSHHPGAMATEVH
jgi:competence protein ComEC